MPPRGPKTVRICGSRISVCLDTARDEVYSSAASNILLSARAGMELVNEVSIVLVALWRSVEEVIMQVHAIVNCVHDDSS
jgi:hypothetical protein